MKLATKIAVLVIGVLVLAVLSSLVALFSSRRLSELTQSMVAENLASIKAAEELEIALLEQRGFVSAYILDNGNPAWLEQLRNRQPGFEQWLERVRKTSYTAREVELVGRIEEVYRRYDAQRSAVISLYDQGKVAEAKRILLYDVNALYLQAYALCEEFLAANERHIEARIADGQAQLRNNTLVVGLGMVLTAGCSMGLLWFFFQGILLPLRQMAREAGTFTAGGSGAAAGVSPRDELRQVGFYLNSLMSDVSETRSDLEHSRAQLLQAENLASVGRLAASVAHEIRNPLTSLKMRLFSLRQALGADPLCAGDFQVVSEEISRLESIIRNFLEFSRPPELKLRPQSLELLLDKALELFGHRLYEKDIELVRQGGADLPVVADADQLKQVFINLLANAAEALPEGGRLRISTVPEQDRDGRRMAAVRFADNGPGIPAEFQERIFEPFFTTKDEGTGLGLCISAQIMARHGGRLELEPAAPPGAVFVVRIPIAREEKG
jgi:signal transduction histidine kinase